MSERLRELLAIMARLRGPDGCPWDREQTFASIAPYTIEEAYEVADAIERNDMPHLKDELGDVLFQVVFHAQIAQEAGLFGFDGTRTCSERSNLCPWMSPAKSRCGKTSRRANVRRRRRRGPRVATRRLKPAPPLRPAHWTGCP